MRLKRGHPPWCTPLIRLCPCLVCFGLNTCLRLKLTTPMEAGAGASLPLEAGILLGANCRTAGWRGSGTDLPAAVGAAPQPSATGSARTRGWVDHTPPA